MPLALPVVALPLAVLVVLAGGCSAPLAYAPREPALAGERTAFAARSLQGGALADFLRDAGRALPADGQPWDLEDLALVAGWYSAEVSAAQVRWQAAVEQARLGPARTAPLFDGQLDHHSLTDAARPQPWTLSLGFEFTLPSPLRQTARQAQLDSAVLLARIALGQAFWDARRQVRAAWLQLAGVQAEWPLVQTQCQLAGERVRRVDARVAGGEVPAAEQLRARLVLAQAQAEQQQLAQRRSAAQAALRAAVGLPVEGPAIAVVLPDLPDPDDAGDPASAQPGPGHGRLLPGDAGRDPSRALENRLDLRAAEARFEVADADLRWAVARQYPDISLRPGYEWDQGDHRLRIGLALPLALPSAHVAEVTQARDEREARARELVGRQAAVVQELDLAALALAAARTALRTQDAVLDGARRQVEATETARRHGEVDALAAVEARSALVTLQLRQVQAGQEVLRRRAELEDAVQQPLERLVAQGAAAAGGAPAAGRPAGSGT